MRVINVRNVHEALPVGIELLKKEGIKRESRNGPVLVYPGPVTTVYRNPCERVIFWPERDANPFFHLYESLWMLGGRNDIAPLVKFAKQIASYSDDGTTMHGAYGYRWRKAFPLVSQKGPISQYMPTDQLAVIADQLTKDKTDRRSVLQMWDSIVDLGRNGKDVPCNTIATFQVNHLGALDLTVFCRSNDIIWGAYGANAVHFSILLEYMANWIGIPVGVYNQISVNYHAYLNTLEPLTNLDGHIWINPYYETGFYLNAKVLSLPKSIESFDMHLVELLAFVDFDKKNLEYHRILNDDEPFIEMCYAMFRAHRVFKQEPAPAKYDLALAILSKQPQDIDWVIAGKDWIQRRKDKWVRDGDTVQS